MRYLSFPAILLPLLLLVLSPWAALGAQSLECSHPVGEPNDKLATGDGTDCLLHPAGSYQKETGHNCPGVSPYMKVTAGFQCEECGELKPLDQAQATGYGECLVAFPQCPPILLGVNYLSTSLNIEIQNRRYLLVCLDGGVTRTDGYCMCPQCGDSHTPIVVSLEDGAVELTGPEDGVAFDLDADGTPDLTAWTRAGSDEAFLVLDRDASGSIEDGSELFGDATPQPIADPELRNGFAALAVFDDALSGGNEDGVIDANDEIFSSLQLWIDRNHNGVSEADELISLEEAGLVAIDLEYRTLGRKDRHGNELRFASRVEMKDRVTRAWDVFFRQL